MTTCNCVSYMDVYQNTDTENTSYTENGAGMGKKSAADGK